jgi:mono/diheme cytochrome c family protein
MHGKTMVLLATLLIITGTGVAKAFHDAGPGEARIATELRSRIPAADDPLALGKQVYETLCIACHTMESPATLAPPMTHVARHIRQAFTDADSAVAHIVEFVRRPSEERSKMPARVRERYGLMAPLDLPEAQLRAVAAYIWSLPDPAPH